MHEMRMRWVTVFTVLHVTLQTHCRFFAGERRSKKRIRFTCSVAPLFLPSRLYHFLSPYPYIFCSEILPFSSPHHLQRRRGREMEMGMRKSHDKHVQEQQLELERNSVAISIPFYLHISPLLFSCLFTLIPVNILGECLSLMRDRHICEWMGKLIVERKEDKIVKMFSQLNDPSSERRFSKTVSQGVTEDKMIVMNMRSEKREFNTRSSWMRGEKENYRVEIFYPGEREREGERRSSSDHAPFTATHHSLFLDNLQIWKF